MKTRHLVNLLITSVDKESDPVKKAQILIEFAVSVSDEVLKRAGVHEDSGVWQYSRLACSFDVRRDALGDLATTADLTLHVVPSSLNNEGEWPPTEHQFLFCRERVVEWNPRTGRPMRILTYEETARFVVFWLAEKILQITRKNEWDRVREMPELFDRLANIWSENK